MLYAFIDWDTTNEPEMLWLPLNWFEPVVASELVFIVWVGAQEAETANELDIDVEELIAKDAVNAYEALTAFNIDPLKNEAVCAFWANEAVKAYEELTVNEAVWTKEAVNAKSAYEEVPNNEPVILYEPDRNCSGLINAILS